jgi:hypothetical protein
MRALPAITGVALGGTAVAVFYRYLTADVRAMKDQIPDVSPPPPGKSGWRLVDKMLPKLAGIAQSTGTPLGLHVGWICKESGGKLSIHPQPGPGDTSMDERGYYQLAPGESKKLGLDHQRLSTDGDYSLQAGTALIADYEAFVQKLGVDAAPRGSALYWRLVKLCHTVGDGQTKKWVSAAKDAGTMGSWADFKEFVLGRRWRGPQPQKWLPFMDEVYRVGKPFGFGDDSGERSAVAGWRPSVGLIGIDVFTI